MFTLQSLRKDTFAWDTALSLATASKLSYENERAVQDRIKKVWGLDACEFIDVGNTQGFVAQSSDVALVAFRGTEGVGDWLGNLQIHRTRMPYGGVHSGFLAGFHLAKARIEQALARGAGGKRIWLTGHSLGGALATIAAAELGEGLSLAGIYTCGQPRVGDGELQAFFRARFPGRFFRFVNNADLVTRVPWNLQHVGSLIHFDARGEVREAPVGAETTDIELPPLTEEEFRRMQDDIRQVEAALAQRGLAGQESVREASIEGLLPGLSDHDIDRYVAIIRRLAGESSRDATVDLEFERRASLESAVIEGTTAARTSNLLPVLLRLRDANWKAPGGMVVNSQIGTIVSAQAPADVLVSLEKDANIVSIEASREAGTLDLAASLPFVRADQVHRPPIAEEGQAALVGIIDSGVDVLHEAFVDDRGGTRILAYWDQADPLGPSPKALDSRFTQDYGTLYLASDIDRMISSLQVTPRALRDPGQHGTHVASIAAGRAVGGLSDGMAPQARLIVVSPHMKTAPNDPPSLGYSSSHVDALHFLKVAAGGGNVILANGLPMAVNVSLGMNAGAHDGSSALEAAFDSITDSGRDPGFVIVKSAGNERAQAGHVRIRAFLGLASIQWTATATATSTPRLQDYFEVWYSFLDELEFTLVDPSGNRSTTVSRSHPDASDTLGENTCSLRLTELHPDNGDNRLVISITPRRSSIQTGVWTLEVLGKQVLSAAGLVDMWIERQGVRGVRFQNDDPKVTLSIPGTAHSVITVGSCHSAMPFRVSRFSSQGLTRKGNSKPDVCAPGDNITAAHAAQSNHRAVIAKPGTSMAAPHVTGALALVLSRRQKSGRVPQYNAQQLRAGLIRSARFFSHVHNEESGYGMLDVAALMATLPP